MAFPFYNQYDKMDCGPTCLRMIAKYYGKHYTLQSLRAFSNISRSGTSLLGISEAAEKIGFRTLAVTIPFEKLEKDALLPCIAHWNQNHFVVVYKIKKNNVFIADPGLGLLKYSRQDFSNAWLSHNKDGNSNGIALLLEPTPHFFEEKDEEKGNGAGGFGFLLKYLFSYKKLLLQLCAGMLIGSLLQLIFPFLTQSIVDFGINHRDYNFIYLILAAQLMLFFSRATVDFIRSWIVLHIGSHINISLVSDFLIKLMKLPIAYFDSKVITDLLQRINDHYRIEGFLTSAVINILFSFFNLFVFSAILAFYDLRIFAVFISGSILYTAWITVFLKRRRHLDFKKFSSMRENQDQLLQLISGMQEIKMHNAEKQKRWEWERIQVKLYKINVRSLKLNQYQQAGAVFVNELKNIIITFLAAKSVIDGYITLGMMLAIQYIIGQLNSPLEQMIGFIHATQDAKLSLERVSEIHHKQEEDETDKISELPSDKSIYIHNLSFAYPGFENVLNEINLLLPQSKITAIVGSSGSGKTTLLKLLLKFYEQHRGEIRVGNYRLCNISNTLWRDKCGVVMQDGFIFSDTIAKNIVVGNEFIDKERLTRAVEVANIRPFIENLPLGFNTKIGSDGQGLSAGQRQRILIARAVYKDPEYIFFDEATNALDANNEKIIMQNLDEFFKGRTVVVVAHRLSTVKNADQIIVLDRGSIVEFGTHAGLTDLKGSYYHLVKNQLELGN